MRMSNLVCTASSVSVSEVYRYSVAIHRERGFDESKV